MCRFAIKNKHVSGKRTEIRNKEEVERIVRKYKNKEILNFKKKHTAKITRQAKTYDQIFLLFQCSFMLN